MWKWLLPALCALVTILMIATIFDVFGFGGKPWFGFLDGTVAPSETPFVAVFVAVAKGGASDRSGFRVGDKIDLRRLDANGRKLLSAQPTTIESYTIPVLRDRRATIVHFRASTTYDGNTALKITANLLWIVAFLWALGCAWVVSLRRAAKREARYLALALLAIPALVLSPLSTAWPGGRIASIQYIALGLVDVALALIPVALARSFGIHTTTRRFVESAAIVAALAFLGLCLGIAIGIWNAAFDPVALLLGFWGQIPIVSLFGLSLAVVVIAAATTVRSERAHTAWLLLPIPIAMFVANLFVVLTTLATTWEANMVLTAMANAAVLLGAAAVTYALLKRRVLDFQFVVSRALVLAGVSTIVVAAFVLLEWLLGSVLVNVSHATGVAANAGLALVLGLSMRAMHRRIDRFVDFTFFHERRENEMALRDFAKEASFVTERDALLNQAIDQVRHHTGATAAALYVNGSRTFDAVRWYGEQPAPADENDPLLLALKAKHVPADPHRYATALTGDIALPMLARGRLVGVLVCGPKTTGEAFAPDEVEAMSDFAHGVGSALEAIDRADPENGRDDAILTELRTIRHLLESH